MLGYRICCEHPSQSGAGVDNRSGRMVLRGQLHKFMYMLCILLEIVKGVLIGIINPIITSEVTAVTGHRIHQRNQPKFKPPL